ncbi:MAG TPA: Ig-like domain-containing protein, partial [Gemmatimonadales bacterium]|nr:Ig-like domain-containing protein [Gemmatimonadales bacterium]
MTFKHKLSRRLALMRNVLVGIALLAGCQEIASLLTQTFTVIVSPATDSVVVGQTIQLTATPQDASGQPLPGKTVTWQTSDATIAAVNDTGLVRGMAEGSAVVTATSEGKYGLAAIKVQRAVA